jgi:CheY-like chemotaxis protein
MNGDQKPGNGCQLSADRWHVLVAEDDAEMRSLLALSFRRAGWEVTEVQDGGELLARLHRIFIERRPCIFDLIVSDIRMPEVRGTKAISWLSVVPELPPFIFITAFGSEAVHGEAARLGAAGIFDKPFDIDDLLVKARQTVRSHGARRGAREQ